MSTPEDPAPPSPDVDLDSATRFPWGTIRWLVNDELNGSSDLTFGVVEIEPGAKNPRHRHPNCDEVLYVIEGELEHTLDDDSVHLAPGMALHIPRDVPHDAANPGPSVARLVVCYSTGDRETVLC